MCVSSQAGCGMNCPFCATGPGRAHPQPVDRGDRRAGASAGRGRSPRGEVAGGPGRVSNVVFMGMGEPLANYTRGPRRGAPAGRPGARTVSACRPAASPCRPSAWCRAMRQLAAEGLPVTLALVAARAGRRAARHPRAGQHPVEGGRGRSTRRGDYADVTGRRVSHRVRPDPGHQRPGVARRPARPSCAARRAGARQPHPAQPHARVEVDGVATPRTSASSSAASRPRGIADHRPRHPRPRDRRRLRPARRHGVAPAASAPVVAATATPLVGSVTAEPSRSDGLRQMAPCRRIRTTHGPYAQPTPAASRTRTGSGARPRRAVDWDAEPPTVARRLATPRSTAGSPAGG